MNQLRLPDDSALHTVEAVAPLPSSRFAAAYTVAVKLVAGELQSNYDWRGFLRSYQSFCREIASEQPPSGADANAAFVTLYGLEQAYISWLNSGDNPRWPISELAQNYPAIAVVRSASTALNR